MHQVIRLLWKNTRFPPAYILGMLLGKCLIKFSFKTLEEGLQSGQARWILNEQQRAKSVNAN